MRVLLLAQATLTLSLAVGGCASTAPAPDSSAPQTPSDTRAALGDVRVPLGETVAVDGVPVRFVSVVEDSRCPPDVTCVWAGRARIALTVGGQAVTLAVPPDTEMPTEATLGGLTVRVAGLAGPAPSNRPAGDPLPMWADLVTSRKDTAGPR